MIYRTHVKLFVLNTQVWNLFCDLSLRRSPLPDTLYTSNTVDFGFNQRRQKSGNIEEFYNVIDFA